jgi:hypothetical protein
MLARLRRSWEIIQNQKIDQLMESNNEILNRILGEIRSAQGGQPSTTAHSVYVSGLFEDGQPNPVLNRILGEIRSAQAGQPSTTAHSVYVSGLFEDDQPEKS